MKPCTITAILFLVAIQSYAQNTAIDSLNRLISKARTDTERINLANEKIRIVGEINIDSSIALAKKNIDDAKKINYKRGEADALISMAGNFSVKGDYVSAAQNLRKAETISALLKDSFLIANVYAGYGIMYGIQSKYDTSILYYAKSIGIDERLGNTKGLGTSYGNIAIGYQMQSNFPVALMYQQKSLRIAEELGNITSQAYTLMNMGNTYQNIGDTAKSEKAILKGIELAKSVGIKNVELYGYSNLATLYDILNKWDKSYNVAMQAAALAKTMGDVGIQASSISKAALALAKNKKYTGAEALNKNALALADSSGQPLNISQVYAGTGAILKMQEKYKEAIPFLEKSIYVLKDADRYDGAIANAYQDLSLCYEKTGNYNKALANYKVSTEIQDSVRSKENIRKATELSMNYEFEKKQAIANAIQGKKNAETRLKQLLLLAGLGVTIVLAVGTWIAFRNKQKANALLQQQKTEIQSTLTQLKATQAQLIQSEKMASLGEVTAGIAHEIQNPLNFVNNFSELSVELIDEMEAAMNGGNTDEVKIIAGDIKKNLEKINHHGRRADTIVKGMLQHSRSTNAVKEPTNINVLASEYLRISYHGLRAKDKSFNVAIHTHLDETIGKINIVQQDIGRVLLNLFTNAFYSFNEKIRHLAKTDVAGSTAYKPAISISTKSVQSPSGDLGVEIRVRDNGMGIPQKVLNKIFQPFFTTKPTGMGTGLGLSLSYDIIKAHDGGLKVETEEGEFAEFIIQLPAT